MNGGRDRMRLINLYTTNCILFDYTTAVIQLLTIWFGHTNSSCQDDETGS